MSRAASDDGSDDRLRQLLDVEERLQALVRAAETRAAATVEHAREEAERLTARAATEKAREAAAQAQADRDAHGAAMRAIVVDGQAALESLSNIDDARIDALARVALERAIGDTEGTP